MVNTARERGTEEEKPLKALWQKRLTGQIDARKGVKKSLLLSIPIFQHPYSRIVTSLSDFQPFQYFVFQPCIPLSL